MDPAAVAGRVIGPSSTLSTRAQRVVNLNRRPDRRSGRVVARRFDGARLCGRVPYRCVGQNAVRIGRDIGCFGRNAVRIGRDIRCFEQSAVHIGRDIGCFGQNAVRIGRDIGCCERDAVLTDRRIIGSRSTPFASLGAESAALVVRPQCLQDLVAQAGEAEEGVDEMERLGVEGVEVAHGGCALSSHNQEEILAVGELAMVGGELAIGLVETAKPNFAVDGLARQRVGQAQGRVLKPSEQFTDVFPERFDVSRGGAGKGVKLGAGFLAESGVDRSTDSNCLRVELLLGDLHEASLGGVTVGGGEGVLVVELCQLVTGVLDGSGGELERQPVIGQCLAVEQGGRQAVVDGFGDGGSIDMNCCDESLGIFDAERHHLR